MHNQVEVQTIAHTLPHTITTKSVSRSKHKAESIDLSFDWYGEDELKDLELDKDDTDDDDDEAAADSDDMEVKVMFVDTEELELPMSVSISLYELVTSRLPFFLDSLLFDSLQCWWCFLLQFFFAWTKP